MLAITLWVNKEITKKLSARIRTLHSELYVVTIHSLEFQFLIPHRITSMSNIMVTYIKQVAKNLITFYPSSFSVDNRTVVQPQPPGMETASPRRWPWGLQGVGTAAFWRCRQTLPSTLSHLYTTMRHHFIVHIYLCFY